MEVRISQGDYFAAAVRTMEAAKDYDERTRAALERLSSSYFNRALGFRLTGDRGLNPMPRSTRWPVGQGRACFR